MTDVHPATQVLIAAALIQFWFLPLGAWWMLGRRHDRPARMWFAGTAVYALTATLYVISWRSPGSTASLGVVVASSLSVILLLEALRLETSTKRSPWVAYILILGLELALQAQQFQPGLPSSALARGLHLSVLAALDITLMVYLWKAYRLWKSSSLTVIGAVFSLFAISNLWRVIELTSNPAAPGLLDFRGSGQVALLLNMLSVVFYSFGYWGFVLDKSMKKELQANQERIATEQRQVLVEQMSRLGRLAQGGALSASIAHEINQPLAALHLGLDMALALSRQETPPAMQRWVAILERARNDATRVHEVIERVQSFFRQAPKTKTCQDFDSLVKRVIEISAPRLQSHGVEVSIDAGVKQAAWLIPGEIEHVVLNLVDNAIHALSTSTQPRCLSLASEETTGGDISLHVTDNGPGIDPALQPFIFDLAVTNRVGGTGMGLWLARHVAERHGGQLTVTSRHLGGTMFSLTLPGATRPPAAQSAP